MYIDRGLGEEEVSMIIQNIYDLIEERGSDSSNYFIVCEKCHPPICLDDNESKGLIPRLDQFIKQSNFF